MVIIGGGVIGCSVLYHLTKQGWTDVVLLERKELTAGSTWHAAGGFHTINGNANIARLQAYTCGIYKEIQELSGQDVGAHYVGGLLVAATNQRWEYLRAEHARHHVLGIESELLGPAEIKKLCSIMDTRDVIGAIYDPLEGYLDPSGATYAYAGAAKAAGATIYRHTMVEGLARRPGGEWEVRTNKGVIVAEHVVNAGGLWAREVGKMAGVDLPLVPMEHHYLITDDLPELNGLPEMPSIADLDGGLYLRQEHQGMLLGVYESNAVPWAVAGTPWDYAENELLIPDLDRLGEDLTRGFERYPAIASAGIKRIVNGPFTFSPDGNPLVGPVAGLPNYWVACGVMAGFVQGGGVGRSLAEWMVDGQPSVDVFGMDIARFDTRLPQSVTIARAREFYGRRFDIPYPNETWLAGRPYKTSPLYAAHEAKGAVFLSSFGFEAPAYFAPAGQPFQEQPTFRRSNAFDIIGAECRALRSAVGVVDLSAVSKFFVSGPDAEAFLRKVVASPLPSIGRTVPALLLSAAGRIIGDLNVGCRADGRYFLTAPTFMQAVYERCFLEHARNFDVTLRNATDELGALFVAGPRAVELIDALSAHYRIGTALKSGDLAEAAIGYAPCHVVASDRIGERGFELYTPNVHLEALYRQILITGRAFGVRDIGIRAFSTLVMEQAPGTTLREMSQDHTVAECGSHDLLDHERSDYVGHAAAMASLAHEPEFRLSALRVETLDADPVGEEPVWVGDRYVGYTTSGHYGHTVGYAMAMAFLNEEGRAPGASLEVSVLGERCRARIVTIPFPKLEPMTIELPELVTGQI
ncbi:dimethylglycine dehydrogenase [Sphingosinicella microcystinivorans]|uniref:Dimethylglycine dehydrogenase n=1 Tax=Sphingosinicella microcystinivorans TaxID=335406 RepID=A0AAD1D6F3_SPHMI|nr:dimethylglycine dehydrogenase [Sphingosinicella microcystinivorans]BBE34187.1 dimethylglycine dehydrogenase [Sphingosinicella microcystinivorans]